MFGPHCMSKNVFQGKLIQFSGESRRITWQG